MLKENKGTIILTTLITAAPVLLGLLLWSRLPDTIATHFDIAGEPNGWSSKAFAVFAIPGFLVVCQLLCTFGTMTDPRKKNIQQKMFRLVLWICPAVSLLAGFMTLSAALGMALRTEKLVLIFLGILFIVIGNYLPKCRQNYTIGIRVMWALEDEENWAATHRFASRLWVGCGVVILLLAFLPWGAAGLWISLGLILVASLASVLYSYIFYRRKPG